MFAVIGDIHANWEAFSTVLDYLRKQNITEIYSVGDSIGYGPDPEAVMEKMQEYKIKNCLGNHEEAVNDPLLASLYFNDAAGKAVTYTAELLTEPQKGYLAELPRNYAIREYLFTHTLGSNKGNWPYIRSYTDANTYFDKFKQRVCFMGHTHCPAIFSETDEIIIKEKLTLQQNGRYIVNVGSVGQPRDGDPRACFVIMNEDEQTIQYVRLTYPVHITKKKILGKGLPAYLADRLEIGR